MSPTVLALDLANINIYAPYTARLDHHHNSHNTTQITTTDSHNNSSICLYHGCRVGLPVIKEKILPELPRDANEERDPPSQRHSIPVEEYANISVEQYFQQFRNSALGGNTQTSSSQTPDTPVRGGDRDEQPQTFPTSLSTASSPSSRFKSNNPFRSLIQERESSGRKEKPRIHPCPVCGTLLEPTSKAGWPDGFTLDSLSPFPTLRPTGAFDAGAGSSKVSSPAGCTSQHRPSCTCSLRPGGCSDSQTIKPVPLAPRPDVPHAAHLSRSYLTTPCSNNGLLSPICTCSQNLNNREAI